MRSLSDTLLLAQKQRLRRPSLALAARQYGHPQKAGGSSGSSSDGLQWGMLGWHLLYSTDSISPFYHGVAIAGDGSLNRVRTATGGGIIRHQRVVNPDENSDYTNWNVLDSANVPSNSPCAISAMESEVIVFAKWKDNAYLAYTLSSDYGASFSGFTYHPQLVCNSLQAVACCHKDDGNMCVVWADGANNLSLSLRTGGYGGSWLEKTTQQDDPDVYALAVYFDGDYNIIALINTGTTMSLARIVYGQGYRVAEYNWSSIDYLNMGRADVEEEDLLEQYLTQQPAYSDFEQAAEDYNAIRQNWRPSKYMVTVGVPWEVGYMPKFMVSARRWSKISAILAARGADNLDVDAPFITKPASGAPILSFYKDQDRWFYRLRPRTDFYDSDWYKAYKKYGPCTYGLALACDSTYLWGTRANEVWRAFLPGKCWPTPDAGTGPNASSVTISQAEIVYLRETIRSLAKSELHLELDNSAGAYSDLPTEHINQGSRIELQYGYRTSTDERTGGNNYFLESWSYTRSANRATVTMHCIDAWGLLELYTVPGPTEFNLDSDTYTVYDLVEKLMSCIGGTLSYKSRSSAIISIYPRMEVHQGESGAGVLRRLLDLVPDVIFFNGLSAYIVYPQESDTPTYSFSFPIS